MYLISTCWAALNELCDIYVGAWKIIWIRFSEKVTVQRQVRSRRQRNKHGRRPKAKESEVYWGQDSCHRAVPGGVTRAVLGGEAMKGLPGQVTGPELYLFAAWWSQCSRCLQEKTFFVLLKPQMYTFLSAKRRCHGEMHLDRRYSRVFNDSEPEWICQIGIITSSICNDFVIHMCKCPYLSR